MSRIHEDHNGVYVTAISMDQNGKNVDGHLYFIDIPGTKDPTAYSPPQRVILEFQNGPVKEAGAKGITNEALLAILVHRMKHLNEKFSCRENSIVITKLEESLMWLEKRTKDRIARGVEGQHKA